VGKTHLTRRSRISLSVWAGLVALIGILAAASPATAKTSKFVGDAPGWITCALSEKMTFSPPITDAGGGTGASAVTGNLSACAASDSRVIHVSGKLTGSFMKSPIDCATLSATRVSSAFNITWKGGFHGSVGANTYAGPAKFAASALSSSAEEFIPDGLNEDLLLPGPFGTSVMSGSFANDSISITRSSKLQQSITAACASQKGLTTLVLVGTITTAPPPPPPPPPSAQVAVQVVDPTDAPLGGADVTITYADGQSFGQRSGADGTASFSGQQVGVAATITASLAGYQSASVQEQFTAGSNNVTVTLVPTAPPPSATVNVTVVDQSGNTVQGADVTITYSSGATAGPITTDGSGNASFSDQPVGVPATITATSSDGSSTGTASFASGFVNGANPALVSLIPPPPPPTATVSVNVTDSANGGAPIAGASVAIYFGVSSTVFATQTTDGSGYATFSGLPVGVVANIVVTTNDGRMQTQSVTSGFAAGSNPTVSIEI